MATILTPFEWFLMKYCLNDYPYIHLKGIYFDL